MALRNAFADLATEDTADSAVSLLTRIFNLLSSPMGFDRSLSRQRVTGIIESGTITTVTTVTTVTNLSTIDTIQGRLLPLNQNASAWAATVRSRIS
jgi:Fe2+ transport system protein B